MSYSLARSPLRLPGSADINVTACYRNTKVQCLFLTGMGRITPAFVLCIAVIWGSMLLWWLIQFTLTQLSLCSLMRLLDKFSAPESRRALSSEERVANDSEYFTDQFLSLSCYGRCLSRPFVFAVQHRFSLWESIVASVAMSCKVNWSILSMPSAWASKAHFWRDRSLGPWPDMTRSCWYGWIERYPSISKYCCFDVQKISHP